MYFLSCFVKGGLFSHSDLSTWEGQELSWSWIFKNTRQTEIHPFELPLSPVCTKPSFQGVHKSRKTHYWSQTRTHACSAVISGDVPHNLNMNFSFISSPLRGKVAFHVALNFCNAWWHCGIYMAGWSGVFCNGFIYSYSLHWTFFFIILWGIYSVQS